MRAILGALLVAVPWGAAPAAFSQSSERAVPPSKVEVNPLALEWQLLGHLARKRPEQMEEIQRRGATLKSFAGKGYTVEAAHPDRKPERAHVVMLQNAYAALVAVPVREAQYEVQDLYRRERIRIRPSAKTTRGAGPEKLIDAYLEAVEAETKGRERNIGTSQSVRELRGGRLEDGIVVQGQIDELRRQIEALNALERRLKELRPRVTQYEAVAKSVERLARPDARDNRLHDVSWLAARAAETETMLVDVQGVGTHQIRAFVEESTRKAIEEELARRRDAGETVAREKLTFVDGKLDFLPAIWKETEGERPRGDYRITEYVCGEDVLLTIFDCDGVFYRVTIVESDGKFCVLVPSKTLEETAKEKEKEKAK